MHLGAGDLLQQAREFVVTTRPPGSPAHDHYGCARHAREYSRLQVMLAWRPSITNWTARAASRTPRTRESTLAPVSPKSRITRGARSSELRVRSRITKSTAMNRATWPGLLPPVKRRTVVIAPGPARSGMARGRRRCPAGRIPPPVRARSWRASPKAGRRPCRERGERAAGRRRSEKPEVRYLGLRAARRRPARTGRV